MTQRTYRHPQVNLRMPQDKKEQMMKRAEENGRSLNQEINSAIDAWLQRHEGASTLTTEERMTRIEERLARLEQTGVQQPE